VEPLSALTAGELNRTIAQLLSSTDLAGSRWLPEELDDIATSGKLPGFSLEALRALGTRRCAAAEQGCGGHPSHQWL
jgi:hypothetical protein